MSASDMTIRVGRATARHVAAEFTMELAVAAEAMDKGAVSVSTGRLLDVRRGEVVPDDACGGCPAERSMGSVVIVEVDESVVGVGALGF